METGKLYFIKDSFYDRFSNCGLLENKDIINGKEHDRPCCYALKFNNGDKNIYWMIPISSKIEKYKQKYLNYIRNGHNEIQNFMINNAVISVGIHKKDFKL